MFPIILKDGPTAEPDSPIYYEVAANGVFEVRRTALFESVTRAVRGVPGLQKQEESCRWLAPRIPAGIMEAATAFFVDVYRYCDGEGVVLLFYNPDTGEYCMKVPEQTIPVYRTWQGRWYTSLELRYEHCDRPEGFLRCGSIHSHADLSAYASHTDCVDEENLDGIHAVVGDLHRTYVTLAAALTGSGKRQDKYTYDLIEPFDMARGLAGGAPEEWLERVHLEYKARDWFSRRSLAELVRDARANVWEPGNRQPEPIAAPTGGGDDDTSPDEPH